MQWSSSRSSRPASERTGRPSPSSGSRRARSGRGEDVAPGAPRPAELQRPAGRAADRRRRAGSLARVHNEQRRDRSACGDPRSVTSALTSAAGVTSNAGLRHRVPASVSCAPARRTSSGSRSSISISAARAVRVDRRRRPGDDELDPGGARGERQRVRADLIGDVAVRRDAVTADDHGSDRSAGDQAGRGRVDDQLVRDRQPASSYTVSRAPWSSGRDSVASTPSSCRAGQLGDDPERGAGSGRCERAGVAVGQDPPRAGQQIGAVGSHRVAGAALLGVNRPAPRRAPPPAGRAVGAEHGGADPVDRPRQVDGRRAGPPQEPAAPAPVRDSGSRGELDRDAVRGRDADQRRSTDREPADRAGDLAALRS